LGEEKLPLSDIYKILSYKNIYKTDKWWEAIVLTEAFGKKSVNFYLWIKRGGKWKRKHKFVVRGLDEWLQIKSTVESMLSATSSGEQPSH
jgi:hypothetical protein